MAQKSGDFRGCYGNSCVYVAESKQDRRDTLIGSDRTQLWAVNDTSMIKFIFSDEIPQESMKTIWISPVAGQKIVPAFFDASRYLRADPDPFITQLVALLNQDNIQQTVETLSAYHSRNSYSQTAVQASNDLQALMTSLGCQKARLMPFRAGMSSNVICEIPGLDNTLPAVLIGAHYDSRSTGVSDPNQRAPGADDNGSGTAAVLEIIRAVMECANTYEFNFQRTMVFALFSGEEQGLIGSAALASQYSSGGIPLTAMINLDMIGYPQASSPNTLYYMSGSTSRQLNELWVELTKLYLGQATVVASTSACCSDQQSFFSRGYLALSLFESTSAFNNPNYHRSTDLPNTVTYRHVFRNAQSAAALIGTLAEPCCL